MTTYEETPLQRGFDAVVRRLGPAILAACRVAVAVDDAIVAFGRALKGEQ